MGDKNFKWYYGTGRDPEICYAAEDREDAIAQGRDMAGDDGFTILESDKMVVEFPFDCDDLIGIIIDRNEDLWGEDGPPDISPTPEQAKELEEAMKKAFSDWVEKNKIDFQVWTFGETRVSEYFPSSEGEEE